MRYCDVASFKRAVHCTVKVEAVKRSREGGGLVKRKMLTWGVGGGFGSS
jgi:hypothetical protein